MAEPMHVAIKDVQKNRHTIFNLMEATIAFGEKFAEITTGQGVKFRANPEEVLSVLNAAGLEVLQVSKEPVEEEEEAEQAPVVEGDENAEV